MNRRLSIREAAEAEINEAADFYDARIPGLGDTFLDEIERAIGRISEFPEAASLIRTRLDSCFLTLVNRVHGLELDFVAV